MTRPVEGGVDIFAESELVISFEILLAGVGERTVADIYAPAAKLEIAHAMAGQTAERGSSADLVVLATPQVASGDETERDGAVYVRIIDSLLAPVRHDGAQKESEILHDLLLDIDSAAGLEVAAVQRIEPWGQIAGADRVLNNIVDIAKAAIVAVSEKFDGARLSEKFVASFELRDGHVLPKQFGLDVETVGDRGELENAGSSRPPILLPLDREAMGIAPRVGGVIEGTQRVESEVQKAGRRIVRVNIVVEDVADREFSEGNDDAVTIDLTRDLVLYRFEHLAARALVRILPSLALAKSDDLAQKIALETHVGRRAAHLGDGAVNIRGGAD
jgi:hypothetical protein